MICTCTTRHGSPEIQNKVLVAGGEDIQDRLPFSPDQDKHAASGQTPASNAHSRK